MRRVRTSNRVWALAPFARRVRSASLPGTSSCSLTERRKRARSRGNRAFVSRRGTTTRALHPIRCISVGSLEGSTSANRREGRHRARCAGCVSVRGFDSIVAPRRFARGARRRSRMFGFAPDCSGAPRPRWFRRGRRRGSPSDERVPPPNERDRSPHSLVDARGSVSCRPDPCDVACANIDRSRSGRDGRVGRKRVRLRRT